MALEIECKYLGLDHKKLVQKLAPMGQKVGRFFEHNLVFETEPPLLSRGKLLRLRTTWDAQKNVAHLLTLKLPKEGHDADFKVRDEREMPISDPYALTEILSGLGYQIFARYEKVREVWKVDQCELDLDTLPFMQCVEIEGEAEAIRALEQKLDLTDVVKSQASYHALHKAYFQEQGLAWEPSFVFSKDEVECLCAEFGLDPEVVRG